MTESAPCRNNPELYESLTYEDHARARQSCVNPDDSPRCPIYAACSATARDIQTGIHQSGLHGTWAGKLYGSKNGRRKAGFQPNPREHGTDRGYYQHRHLKEDACAKCLEAHRFEVWLRKRYGASA